MTHKKLQKLRKAILYLWMVVMPISFNFVSPVLIIMAGFDATINFSFILFSAWFVSSLFLGRAYCAYACQWGAGQEVYANMNSKPLDPKTKRRNSKIKYAVFVLWIAFIIMGPIAAGGYINGFQPGYPNLPGDVQWSSFDATAPGSLIFYFGIQISIVFLFCGIGGNRSFCRYACPMGVLGIIGTKIKNTLKYPSLHLESDKEKCTQCTQCSKACAMGLDVHEMVDKGDMMNNDCIMCGMCIDACPRNVIDYAWKWKK